MSIRMSVCVSVLLSLITYNVKQTKYFAFHYQEDGHYELARARVRACVCVCVRVLSVGGGGGGGGGVLISTAYWYFLFFLNH